MTILEVEDDIVCQICGVELQVNCLLDVHSSLGACNECGLPYTFESVASEDGRYYLQEVETAFDSKAQDWDIIKSYYESTSEMAVTIGCVEVDEETVEKFHSIVSSNSLMSVSSSV